jgi:hypothetical protein
MRTIKTRENFRLSGFDDLNDLFCFPNFFDPMMLPAAGRLYSLRLRPYKRRTALGFKDNGLNLNTAYFAFG